MGRLWATWWNAGCPIEIIQESGEWLYHECVWNKHWKQQRCWVICHPLVQKEGHRWICRAGFVKGSTCFSAAGTAWGFTPGNMMLKAALQKQIIPLSMSSVCRIWKWKWATVLLMPCRNHLDCQWSCGLNQSLTAGSKSLGDSTGSALFEVCGVTVCFC